MASLRYRIRFLLAIMLCLAALNTRADSAKTQDPLESKVLLLMDYHKARPSNVQEFVMSEKLDGVRALWNGKQLLTRNGRVIKAPACFTKHFPPFALDGELWIGRGEFEKALALVQKDCTHCPCSGDREALDSSRGDSSWGRAKYYVFDVPDCTLESSPKAHCTLFERLRVLESYLASAPTMPISLIKHEPISSEKQLFKRLQELSEQGAEGLVLRKVTAPYERTRSPNALKLKLYEDAECKVVAHNAGKGKYAGKLGSLTCEQIAENGTKRTLRFKIGSGFSDTERQSPPPLGSIITYKFYGTTKNGFPRFAVFHRIYQNP
ncbi:DNA ligase [Helicobacter canis]|uniref:DNA ligase n=1 Tax=Helicobacter canis TaxID=29419 RepID=UPI0026F0279A|nr:DNA ligase [Helicobacter canis]